MSELIPVTTIHEMANFIPQDVLAAMQQNMTAAADSLQSGVRRLSYGGKDMQITVGGQTVILDRVIDVIIVATAPTDHRLYYGRTYNPNEKTPPICWSKNGVTPDETVPAATRGNLTCSGCPFDEKGSGNQGIGRACQRKRRAVVMLANDTEHNLYLTDYSSKTIYEPKETKAGYFNLQGLIQQLGTLQKQSGRLAFTFLVQQSFAPDTVPVVQFSFADQRSQTRDFNPRNASMEAITAAVEAWKSGKVQELLAFDIATPETVDAEHGNGHTQQTGVAHMGHSPVAQQTAPVPQPMQQAVPAQAAPATQSFASQAPQYAANVPPAIIPQAAAQPATPTPTPSAQTNVAQSGGGLVAL